MEGAGSHEDHVAITRRRSFDDPYADIVPKASSPSGLRVSPTAVVIGPSSSDDSQELLRSLQECCRRNNEDVPRTISDALKAARGWAVRAHMDSWLVHNAREFQNHEVQRANNLVTALTDYAVSFPRGSEDILRMNDDSLRQRSVEGAHVSQGTYALDPNPQGGLVSSPPHMCMITMRTELIAGLNVFVCSFVLSSWHFHVVDSY